MTTQPVPAVTAADVDRVVARDYPPTEQPAVHAALAAYGAQDWHPEVFRVRLAILKLADGSLDRVREVTADARSDFRDVLAAAEYPACATYALGSLPDSELKQVYAADWQQYQEWLHRR